MCREFFLPNFIVVNVGVYMGTQHVNSESVASNCDISEMVKDMM